MFEIRRYTQFKNQERCYAPQATGPAYTTRERAEDQLRTVRQFFKPTLVDSEDVKIDFEILPPPNQEELDAFAYADQIMAIPGGVIKPPELPMKTKTDKQAAEYAMALVPDPVLPDDWSV